MTKEHILIAYDIRDPSRLRRVHRLVSQNLLQLQFSVYYGQLSISQLDRLIEQIKQIIKTDLDDVRVHIIEPLEQAYIWGSRHEDVLLLPSS